MLTTLCSSYNNIVNNKITLSEKLNFIEKELSLNSSCPLFLIGILNDFLVNDPQYFYNKKVLDEVFNNLSTLYEEDNKKFIDSFIKYQNNFFHSLNAYYHILDLYNELDDVDFESETRTKIYYLPIITQLMEFCLNHFYRGIASILGEFKDKDYFLQKTLGKLKNILNTQYPNLVNIDINFRNAVSHGTITLVKEGILYSYNENREIVHKKIDFWECNKIKNELVDIASGAFIGWLKFIIEKDIINEEYLTKIENDEKISFELLKLFLNNENIQVKFLLSNTNLEKVLHTHLKIQGIEDKDQLIHLLIYVIKILYAILPSKYSRYQINYTHPYTLDGSIILEQNEIKNILYDESISIIDKKINWEGKIIMADIQDTSIDNRSYKFHRFPKINAQNWEVSNIRDISNMYLKRLEAVLLINKTISSKKEIEKLLFIIMKKIRTLENPQNPKDKIKYGKVEADIVRLKVFYKTNDRNNFELLLDNDKFICFVDYYKSKSLSKIAIKSQEHYTFENIKKFDVYWNRSLIDKINKSI